MKKSIITLTILSATLASSVLMAGTAAPTPATAVITGASSKTSTNAYAGLSWSLGGSLTPSFVLGLSNTKVKSDGDTTGANLALHFNLADGIRPGKLKLGYLTGGRENLQGEVGGGYGLQQGGTSRLTGLGCSSYFSRRRCLYEFQSGSLCHPA